MAVLVLDKTGKALMPCTEKRARLLLASGRARVHRLMPFVIRLVDRHADSCEFQPLRLKLDPGSKTTGLALVRETDSGLDVLNLFELVHRGRQISEALTARRQCAAADVETCVTVPHASLIVETKRKAGSRLACNTGSMPQSPG